MNKNNRHIDSAIEQVSSIFEKDVDKVYTYHSFKHSLDVMRSARLIGLQIGMEQHQIELAMLAGIFHDSGHMHGHRDHEAASALLAKEFLQKFPFSQEEIDLVVEAILSTRYPQHPVHLIDKVLCDADLLYLSSENFMEQARLLWTEWKMTGQSNLSLSSFYTVSLRFMLEHRYHTSYGQQTLEPEKNKNIERLKKMTNELDQD